MTRSDAVLSTSDVTRFRGVVMASLLATVATIVAAIALGGGHGLRHEPGPLSRSHQQAGLSCEQCHQDNRRAGTTCAGCHEGHASTRTAHQALVESGALMCADCHAGHGAPPGVRIAEYRGVAEVVVPIIEASRCGACHDYESATDPLAVCLMHENKALGPRQPILCFDEHATVGGYRDAAWEVARHAVAGRELERPSRSIRLGPWSWLGLGGLVGLVGFGASRARPTRRSRSNRTAPVRAPDALRLPVINSQTCLGCHACVDACPFDVLEIRRYVAVVARPAACCGLTLCEQRCPNGSLVMGEASEVEDAVPLDDALQSRLTPGIFLAGDVTGLPLIRNAINQGAHALRALAEDLGRTRGAEEYDVVIVGAGPAGLSAALEAKSLGLRYLVLEQATVAGSIQSFPRAKLVFDQPLELPLVGQLWLEESSKEELLARWMRIVRSERLAIREGMRVTGIRRTTARAFEVRTLDAESQESGISCSRVLLAVGKRGSPRELSVVVPEVMADRVFYSLADARSFAGQRVAVVGLGDVAMEAAIALSRQPGTRVLVAHRGNEFHRGSARNIDEFHRRVRAGAIELHLETTVSAVGNGEITLARPGRVEIREVDGLFVLIGSIPPMEFLGRVGVLPNPKHDKGKEENET